MFTQLENQTLGKPITNKLNSLKRSRTIRKNLNLLDDKFENFDPATGIVYHEPSKRKTTSKQYYHLPRTGKNII